MMKFFEGWVSLFKHDKIDKDLLNWAKVEYKYDSDYAYNYMLTHGRAPSERAFR